MTLLIPNGKKSAAELVQLARYFTGHVDFTIFRDGFSDDADTSGTPIISYLNLAFEELLPTGFQKCYFSVQTIAGQAEYGLVPEINEIRHVTVNGQPLLPVTLLGQDRRFPGWQAPTTAQGAPKQFYTEADVLGLIPTPDQVYTAVIWADSTPNTLAAASDYPGRLPARYHSMLAIGAALFILNQDRENPVAEERVPFLTTVWNKRYAELEELVRSRQDDVDEHIEVDEYRGPRSRY